MDVLYVFISPAQQDFATWLAWRNASRKTPEAAFPLGAGAPLEQLTQLAEGADWKIAIETALRQSRANPGFVLPLPKASEALTRRLSSLAAGTRAWQWLLAATDDGPTLLTAIHGESIKTPLEARRAFVAAMFDQSEMPWREECAALSVDLAGIVLRPELTHLLTLARTGEALSPAFLSAHAEEEGDTSNQSATLASSDIGLGYCHVGYSFTTVAAPTLAPLAFLIPAATRAQSVWCALKGFSDGFGDASLARSLDDSASAPNRLVFFQRFRFNFELWNIATRVFEDSLRPWQRNFFDQFNTGWRLTDMRAVVERGAERLCDALEASVRNTALKAERRQAHILYVLAVVQIIGLIGVVTAYFDLVGRAGVNLAQLIGAGPLLLGIIVFLSATVAISVFLIANRDNERS